MRACETGKCEYVLMTKESALPNLLGECAVAADIFGDSDCPLSEKWSAEHDAEELALRAEGLL